MRSVLATAVRTCRPCAAINTHVRLFSASPRPLSEDDKNDAGPSRSPLAENHQYIGPEEVDTFQNEDGLGDEQAELPSWISRRLEKLSSEPPASRGQAQHRQTAEDILGPASGRNKRQDTLGSLSNTSDTYRRGKPSLLPRSVLFADLNARSTPLSQLPSLSEQISGPGYRAPRSARNNYDRTPLTPQESKAFMSIFYEALSDTPPASSSPDNGDSNATATPFGAYTSLLSDSRTEHGSKNLLQAFASRNRLRRFDETRSDRLTRFAREGIAAQLSHAELEAGNDEAREQITLCDNLADLMAFAKREIWGIVENTKTDEQQQPYVPKYGKHTPFYSSVLHTLFLTIRDRYHAPNTALAVPRITKSLGSESYVLGMTTALYNDMLKTHWEWLGDMHGVVETLKQARSTGNLSLGSSSDGRAGRRADAAALSANAQGGHTSDTYAPGAKDEEAIRETIHRITNDIRQNVFAPRHRGSPAAAEPEPKTDEFGIGSLLDAKAGTPVDIEPVFNDDATSSTWAQRSVLDLAAQAVKLAGTPSRVSFHNAPRENWFDNHTT